MSAQHYNLKIYKTIEQSVLPPPGFKRVELDENSFGFFLRNLPLVADSFPVMDFKNNIRVAAGDSSLAAVIPVDIQGKRLWQCMDIIQALHMEFLKRHNHSKKIVYPLPDGTFFSWQEWQQGVRPVFKGLKFTKPLTTRPDSSVDSYRRYCNFVFEHSNTQTFWHYYPDIKFDKIIPGDFIVKKGRKGHAVLIIDMAVNARGEKVVLIGQGDTPACQFYLLKSKKGHPWFSIDKGEEYPALPIKKKMYWSGLRRFH